VVVFQIKWVEQQVAKRRVKRDVQTMFNDPMWPQQWYLVSTPLHMNHYSCINVAYVKRTLREVVEKNCQSCKLNREDLWIVLNGER